MTVIDFKAFIGRLATSSGETILPFFRTSLSIDNKSVAQDFDPVTEADIAIDSFLKQTLLAARPDYGWMSEETADDLARRTKAHTFIVDPIDGTYGFVKRRPQFTIVAAVVAEGRPVAGVTVGRNYEFRSLDESPGIRPLGLELIGESRDEG